MHLFPDPKIFLSIGPIQITWYALCILTGALFAYGLSQKTVKKWGYGQALLEDYFLPMFALSILGARVYYVLFQWDYYSRYPQEIIQIWHGGLAIHGGLIVGICFSLYYFKKKKVSFLRMFDAIMPNVLLAQAFGRWGNFFNQEAFGNIVPESFYDSFPAFIKDHMYIQGAYREPTFLYESTMNIVGFLLISFVFRRKGYRKHGDCGWAYCIWYGSTRFVIESLRSDSLMLGPIKVAQLISVALVILGVVGLSGKLTRYKKPVLCFACKEKPSRLLDDIARQGYLVTSVFSDTPAETIVQRVDDLGNGHDDCILVTDVVQEVMQAKKIGAYSILVSQDLTDDTACQTIQDINEIKNVIKEEKSWSDNTIW